MRPVTCGVSTRTVRDLSRNYPSPAPKPGQEGSTQPTVAATGADSGSRGRWEVTKGYGGLLKEVEIGDDRTAMALRPFGRNQKKKAQETSPNATDEFAQFFSNDPRTDETSAQKPAVTSTPDLANPAVTMEEQSAAGWYPDTKDPGLMRYWDGFHLTGQTMRVGPERPAAPEPVAPAPVEDRPAAEAPEPSQVPAPASPPAAGTSTKSATDLLAPDVPQVPLLGGGSLPAMPGAGDAVPRPAQAYGATGSDPGTASDEEPAKGDLDSGTGPGTPEPPAAPPAPVAPAPAAPAPAAPAPAAPAPSAPAPSAPAPAPPAPAAPAPVAPAPAPPAPAAPAPAPPVRAASAPAPSAPAPAVVDTDPVEVKNWAERTEQAVARAEATGTPEAWHEAAEAAAVVSEMAQTMQAAADIRKSAEELDRAAREAKQNAEDAERAVTEAQRTVEQTARSAREAAEAANVATRAAEDAKVKAERVSAGAPEVTRRAQQAAEAAAGAKRRAQRVDEIVAKARRADTAEAWSEARRSAELALQSEPRGAFPPGA